MFCLSKGTPESDTSCMRCPEGFFSNETSSKTPCKKHTNCSALGLKTASKGNAVRDNVCQGNGDASAQKCGIGMYNAMCTGIISSYILKMKLPAATVAAITVAKTSDTQVMGKL